MAPRAFAVGSLFEPIEPGVSLRQRVPRGGRRSRHARIVAGTGRADAPPLFSAKRCGVATRVGACPSGKATLTTGPGERPS